MPNVRPVPTNASAKRSAHRRMTTAATTSNPATATRRRVFLNDPIHRAGPTRSGTSDGLPATRTVYAAKMPTSSAASSNVIVRLSGRVSE